MAILQELRHITQKYDGKVALSEVSLDVREGEVLSIIGPNGAGKTTLLRIMSLLDEPAGGAVFYRGVKVGKHNAGELRGKITMIFQRAVLFNTTVHENIAYGLKLRGYPIGEIDRRVKRSLKLVGLKDFSQRKAKRLSGGEQQRVVLARALALEPEFLLLDEPTANLDPASLSLVENIIEDVKKDTTIVLATNDLFQARRLSDRVACLLNGKLIDKGTAGGIFEHPRDERTKKFISGEFF